MKIRIPKKYGYIFDQLEKEKAVTFRPESVGDIGYIRKIQKRINAEFRRESMMSFYDRKTKNGLMVIDRLRVRKRRGFKRSTFYDVTL